MGQPDQTPGSVAVAPGRTKVRVSDHAESREYFRRIRRLIQVGLLLSYLVPIIILSLYFHLQFNFTLKESGKQHLINLAESQRNTVDLFLQERVVNIFNLFSSPGFKPAPTQSDLDRYLQTLQGISDAFVDVGFFNAEGVQIGYAGPYSYLYGKNYSYEAWFKTLMGQEKNYLISDVYLGFRQKAHFTIAVKQALDNQPVVMRATLDPGKFYLFLRSIGRGKGVESAVINREGVYQIVDLDRGELLRPSDYVPAKDVGSGAVELRDREGPVLTAHCWLTEVPWALLVRQPLREAYAQMYRTRNIMIISTAVLVLVMVIAIWFTVERLLRRAQATAESRDELQSELVFAGKLAAAGELAAGVAHEINNPLAVIAAESGLLQDMLDPQFGLDSSPELLKEELKQIDAAVFRARDITQKLLHFVRRREARLVPRNVNEILEDVVSGLMEHQLQVSNVKLIRDYDRETPEILVDPDQLRQVFLNIMNNASDALSGPGAVTLVTRQDEASVRVTITDTGKGMSSEQMQKIFLPFFTTKEVGKGTGLGLAISLSIVEEMGGHLEVQSIPGKGSSFTVVLPKKK